MDHVENWYFEVLIFFPQQNIWFEAQYCSQDVSEEIMLLL